MNYAEFMRELRGEMSLAEYRVLSGVNERTQSKWESGERNPSEESINDLADRFGWTDEERMSLMPEPRSIDKFTQRFERHMQYLRLSTEEVAIVLNQGGNNVRKWRANKVPKNNYPLIRNFLEMEEEEAYRLLYMKDRSKAEIVVKQKMEKRKRKPIRYDLIYKLENEFGTLTKVPNDNETLRELQKAMEWVRIY